MNTPKESNDPVIHKYSKSTAFYRSSKKEFFSENDHLLEKSLSQNKLYASQPIRVYCKICRTPLNEARDFHQHGIDYVFCASCGHLNGRHEDTSEFVESIYVSERGSEYAKLYLDESFVSRAKDIYWPKVEFLLSHTPQSKRKLLDIGCGAGYFVYSALKGGLQASGVDIGKTAIDYGNAQIKHLLSLCPLLACDEGGYIENVRETDANIVSAIGVIEHLREPDRFFSAFTESRADYLFYSVPMFSMTAIFENIFPTIFPRHLSADHTHLFTESSLKKMNEFLNVEVVADWRFGTDFMDLFRCISTTLQKNKVSPELLKYLEAGFGSKIDDLQAVLDNNHFCSEVHVVAKKIS